MNSRNDPQAHRIQDTASFCLGHAPQLLALALAAMVCPAWSAPIAPVAKVTAEAIDLALDAAAKLSGKAAPATSRLAARASIAGAATKWGVPALTAVRRGGLELVDAAAHYGDEVYHLAAQAPQGARALAMRTEELLPLAREIGPDVLRLESRAPGLAAPTASHFGNQGLRDLAAKATPEQIKKMVGLAARADSTNTKLQLMAGFKSHGDSFLRALDARKILAVGLSASMITAAYKVSQGVEDGLVTTAEQNPKLFQKTFVQSLRWITLPLIVVGCAAGLMLLRRMFSMFKV